MRRRGRRMPSRSWCGRASRRLREYVAPTQAPAAMTDALLPAFTAFAIDSKIHRVAGIDEAGRGPLAGPVVVAAVVFAPGRAPINGLNDSKQLDAPRREVLAVRIKA